MTIFNTKVKFTVPSASSITMYIHKGLELLHNLRLLSAYVVVLALPMLVYVTGKLRFGLLVRLEDEQNTGLWLKL